MKFHPNPFSFRNAYIQNSFDIKYSDFYSVWLFHILAEWSRIAADSLTRLDWKQIRGAIKICPKTREILFDLKLVPKS